MVQEFTRAEAILRICHARLQQLSPVERAERVATMKAEVWDSEPGWKCLSPDLRADLEVREETRHPEDPFYDPALLLGLEAEFRGVVNDYLMECLRQHGIEYFEVSGEVDVLLDCPCCSYRTLSRRGVYSICPVCFWEDDGNDHPRRYSGPNHMTLAEGRRNYARLGAVTRRERQFVDPDGPRKYARSPDTP